MTTWNLFHQYFTSFSALRSSAQSTLKWGWQLVKNVTHNFCLRGDQPHQFLTFSESLKLKCVTSAPLVTSDRNPTCLSLVKKKDRSASLLSCINLPWSGLVILRQLIWKKKNIKKLDPLFILSFIFTTAWYVIGSYLKNDLP